MKVLLYEDLRPNKGIHYSKVQLWRKVKEKSFPSPIKLGAGRNGWVEHEIDEWIVHRMAEREDIDRAGAASHARDTSEVQVTKAREA